MLQFLIIKVGVTKGCQSCDKVICLVSKCVCPRRKVLKLDLSESRRPRRLLWGNQLRPLLCQGAFTCRTSSMYELFFRTSRFRVPTPSTIRLRGNRRLSASKSGVMTRRSPMSLLRRTKIVFGKDGGSLVDLEVKLMQRIKISKNDLFNDIREIRSVPT